MVRSGVRARMRSVACCFVAWLLYITWRRQLVTVRMLEPRQLLQQLDQWRGALLHASAESEDSSIHNLARSIWFWSM